MAVYLGLTSATPSPARTGILSMLTSFTKSTYRRSGNQVVMVRIDKDVDLIVMMNGYAGLTDCSRNGYMSMY